ncbi:hypothetical protein M0D45_11595 [Xanthomonas prunicola]|uniref:hypothetical protein n=1 Tax=Xanthomonas prunicola TaxID=2053930 RepID=UPI0021B2A914|nr:hypothetical protein [Xanthomonas prunicola]UXA51400.1 hypothetical protein M0D45_11595 [Xanthomonas prunicola]
MTKKVLVPDEDAGINRIAEAILGVIGNIPESNLKKSQSPERDSKKLTKDAAVKSSLAAGALALPPGPLGWLTIIPELLAVWKIQAQLVADVAAVHGKTSTLTQQHMVYCLFRHAAAQLMRDLVVRVGERALVKRASLRMIQKIVEKIGYKILQRSIGKGISRWLPLVGAAGVAGYAYYDTTQVGKTSVDFFGSEISDEPESDA